LELVNGSDIFSRLWTATAVVVADLIYTNESGAFFSETIIFPIYEYYIFPTHLYINRLFFSFIFLLVYSVIMPIKKMKRSFCFSQIKPI